MSAMELLKAMLFGIVEGVTEWLPVSSTGHMIILNELMPLKVSAEFYSLYEVVIQLGAIMAVLYGALLSGARANDAKRLTWKEFADRFRLTSLPTVKEMLMDKLQQALPEVEASDAANPQ